MVQRRKGIRSVPVLKVASRAVPPLGRLDGAKRPRAAKASAELPDLGELVAKRFHEDGRSCSEAILHAALEFLGEPRELERMATPFAGGMRMGDHCGFYTGGLMAIGLACAGLPDGKETAVRLQKEFTEIWRKSWPLTCREINSGDFRGKCRDIGRAAGKKLQKLLAPLARDPRRVRFISREA